MLCLMWFCLFTKILIIIQVVFGITEGLILVKPDVFEKYFWLSIPVLSFSIAFGLTISKP